MYIPLANIQRDLVPLKIQSPLIVPYSDFFCHFHVETNYYHFECFVTLVTHSQGHRGRHRYTCT